MQMRSKFLDVDDLLTGGSTTSEKCKSAQVVALSCSPMAHSKAICRRVFFGGQLNYT